MFANKNRLVVQQREPVTSGSVNAYEAQFEFSPDWDGLTRMAVFQAGSESKPVLLDETNRCAVPWEVLAQPNVHLLAGVFGTRGLEVVLPTDWADLGVILKGTSAGGGNQPSALVTFGQLMAGLAGKQDKLTGRPGQVVGFDGDGCAEAQDPDEPGSSGGFTAATDEEVNELLDEVFSLAGQ